MNLAHAVFSPDRFAHANLFVTEVETSVAFYRDVCGITEVFREPGIKAGFLSNGATHHDIGLMQVSAKPLLGRDGNIQNMMIKGRKAGLNHLAFHVNSEAALIAAYSAARQQGIAVEKALDHGMSRSLYVTDPDNVTVEFYADTVADWRAYYSAHQNELISAQWSPDISTAIAAFRQPMRVNTQVSGAQFDAIEICGATLVVSDLAVSKRFYRDKAGLQILAESDEAILLALPGSGSPCLALVESVGEDAIGLHSLWFLANPASPGFDQTGDRKRHHLRDPDGMKIALYAGIEALPRFASRAECRSF